MGWLLTTGMIAGSALALLLILGLSAILLLLNALFHNVSVLPPTARQLEEEDPGKHALFRHLPQLHSKVAWRQLGEFPTPVHKCTMKSPGLSACFHVKREDLSSPTYGGNKVRTLQHYLACCEAFSESHSGARFMALGTGGSNLCVAAIVHSQRILGMDLSAMWVLPDAPELDNTLNMMSGLSFAGAHVSWSRPLMILKSLLASVIGLTARNKILHAGGNSIPGILGQMSGALEFAEQVERKEAPDPSAIYLPIGSSCTITGLIVGIALVRKLGTPIAFTNPSLKIVGVPIHHSNAKLHRKFGFYKSNASKYLAITPQHGIRSISRFLRERGCPDVEEDALRFLNESVEIFTCPRVVGTYGAHSDRSLTASVLYEKHANMRDADGAASKELWLCGHFAAKAFAVLLQHLEEEASRAGGYEDETETFQSSCVFWQTKSSVQPRGPEDEWSRFVAMASTSGSVASWAMNGKSMSSMRIGSVDAKLGPGGYRHLMTELE